MGQKETITLNTSTSSLYRWAGFFISLGLGLNLLFHFTAGRLHCLFGCPTEWALLGIMQTIGTCLLYLGLILFITNTTRLAIHQLRLAGRTKLLTDKERAIAVTVSVKLLYLWSVGMLGLNMLAIFFTKYLYANLWCKADRCLGYEAVIFLCQFIVKMSFIVAIVSFIVASVLVIRRKRLQHTKIVHLIVRHFRK